MPQAKISRRRRQQDERKPLTDLDVFRGDVAAIGAAPDFQETKSRVTLLEFLKTSLAGAHNEARVRLESAVFNGLDVAKQLSDFEDALIGAIYDYTVNFVYRAENPTSAEHLGVVAVGGYGRGTLAPGSDIDLLFLRPYKKTAWSESVIEYVLYLLWDLGQKVGHATRSIDECIAMAKKDMTIRTAVLEARFIWGDEALSAELKERFGTQVVGSTGGQDFVEAKLVERDERHVRSGESRYLVEPNLKDGKGGLRDLHTLFWIGKYVYKVERAAELTEHGVFTQEEYRRFARADAFFWTVRCHLHFLTGRAEERLSFDVQTEMAQRLGYADRGGLRGVERFMKHYFLMAKAVGDLTRIFCAALEVQNRKRRPGLGQLLPSFGRKQVFGDFVAEGGRLTVSSNDVFKKDPVNLLRLFHCADAHDLLIHPDVLKLVTRSIRLIDHDLRHDPEANRVFLEILTSKKDAERVLRRMNEAGVFGRFIEDFGRVVAMMQFNMYHHYTVDEHLIRAIGLLAEIDRGEMRDEHPIATEIFPKIQSRNVIYMAVLLHDIAKGRERDHSEEGEEIARYLCPRLGMAKAETDAVAWLVANHLVMSDFAQKRDLADPKTVRDFVEIVQSPERLRLLLMLTIVDIKAVGPGVWNGWKAQLLRELYYEAEAILQGGHTAIGRNERVAAAKARLEERLSDVDSTDVAQALDRHYAPYWLSLDEDAHEKHARMMIGADRSGEPLTVVSDNDVYQAATELTIYAPDHPGLFSRLAGAFAMSGVSVLDAKIFTTSNGMALDIFTLQGQEGGDIKDKKRLKRIRSVIAKTLSGEVRPHEVVGAKSRPRRERAFTVEPQVVIDNQASDTFTLIEVNGLDRTGLLLDLTRSIFGLSLTIGSARIATYGETAVDVFYVKDGYGLKVTHEERLGVIRETILDVLANDDAADADRAAAE
jgi:[protein-PII] uridylyltransferase